MNDELLIENNNPVFPCICGHFITAHGHEMDSVWTLHYDSSTDTESESEEPYPRDICYECGPNDCSFVQMSNLEYLEFKSTKV
jgi:hypothetical protein